MNYLVIVYDCLIVSFVNYLYANNNKGSADVQRTSDMVKHGEGHGRDQTNYHLS